MPKSPITTLRGLTRGRAKAVLAAVLLNAIAANDALMLVARAFEDDGVPHPDGALDPARDLETMESELILNDMTVIDRRLERLKGQRLRGTPDERKRMADEEVVLQRLMAALEDVRPLRDVEISEEERRMLGGFGLLSLKPILRVVNAGDDDAEESFAGLLDERTLVLRGKLEAEIAQMSAEDAKEFLADFGITEPG